MTDLSSESEPRVSFFSSSANRIAVIAVAAAFVIILVIVLLVVFLPRRDVTTQNSTATYTLVNSFRAKGLSSGGGINVFSFSLYGTGAKYCQGMIQNLKLIEKRFPSWETWVYVASDVPKQIVKEMSSYPRAKIIPVTRRANAENMRDRFQPYDAPNVSAFFVRDADSRVCERDAACVEEFMNSDKIAHIIRDQRGQHYKMLGGMWGLKKGALGTKSMFVLLDEYKRKSQDTGYGTDQFFLADMIYPLIVAKSLIHDDYHEFDGEPTHTEFPSPLDGVHFIGQSYDENENPAYQLSDFVGVCECPRAKDVNFVPH